MSTFIGKYLVKADVKGRVFIPSTYRKILPDGNKEQIIMRKDPEKDCLVFYPEKIWSKLVEDLKENLDEWNSDDQMLLMQFVSEAECLDIDSQGRILISKKFQNLIGIESSEVLFVGLVDRFVVWSKSKYEMSVLPKDQFAESLKSRMVKKM